MTVEKIDEKKLSVFKNTVDEAIQNWGGKVGLEIMSQEIEELLVEHYDRGYTEGYHEAHEDGECDTLYPGWI